MKGSAFLIITGFVILCLVLPEGPTGLSGVSANPKKRGGFGSIFSGKKSSSSSGSSYPKQTWSNSGQSGYPQQSGYPGQQSGYPKQNYGGSSGGSYGSSGSTIYGGKKKSSTKSKLKKAAVIGAAVYGGYQLGKLSGKFSSYGGGSWGFNDWNKWREADGMLCRSTQDCQWVDRNLYCQDYELDFQPSALWFGGDVARIVGECSCPQGMFWDDREVQCQQQGSGIGFIIGMIVLALLIMAGCIGVCICCGVKKMFSS